MPTEFNVVPVDGASEMIPQVPSDLLAMVGLTPPLIQSALIPCSRRRELLETLYLAQRVCSRKLSTRD